MTQAGHRMWSSTIPSDLSGCCAPHACGTPLNICPTFRVGASFSSLERMPPSFLSPSASPSGRCCRQVAEFRYFSARRRLPRRASLAQSNHGGTAPHRDHPSPTWNGLCNTHPGPDASSRLQSFQWNFHPDISRQRAPRFSAPEIRPRQDVVLPTHSLGAIL